MPKQHRAAASRSPARPAARKSSKGARMSKRLLQACRVSARTISPNKTCESQRASQGEGVSQGESSTRSGAARPAKGSRQRYGQSGPRAAATARCGHSLRVNLRQRRWPPLRRRHADQRSTRPWPCTRRGVRALQRHDFQAAADSLRGVIQRYPGERELVERARLYLQVCERETARRPSGPQTPSEWVYAATVALNSGDVEGGPRTSQQGSGEGSRQRSRTLYYGCCPSR